MEDRPSTLHPVGRRRHLARLKTEVIALAELDDDIDWDTQVDSTVVRTHQHAAGAAKRG